MKKRLLALIITLCMVLSLVPVSAFAATGDAAEPAVTALKEEPAAVNAESGTKANGTSVLAFTSDTHNKGINSSNNSAARLGTWLDKMTQMYGSIDAMAFGGDMANASASATDYWTFTSQDMQQLDDRNITGVYTTGNHEHSPGRYSSTSTDASMQKFKINTEGAVGDNYRIYCLGSVSSSSSYSSSVSSLTSYLNSVGNDKVIFIITHFPLHYYSGRTTTGASDVIDALNSAVANNGQKIVFLWGHNHTMSDTYYDYIYRPGDKIPTSSSSSSSKTIQFYYGAAGCMSDSEYGGGSASVKGKGLIVKINSSNQLTFTYHNESGTDVTEGGSYSEGPAVAVTGVTVSPKTANVLERKTVTLTATVAPSDASNKAVTWSSSNTSIATVGGSGIVTGVSEGTATITATTADGSFSDSCVVTVLHNDDPSAQETVNVTPSTSNPEQTVRINVGDTLIVNVTNGSSSSAYDFSATLSKSGVAQISGSSSVNIAAGATGQLTFTGQANGTVDITIQNNQSSSSYVRKATIHLTVGDGSTTPVETDTVSITPTTDSPEESAAIKVGETLSINVTNGSSSSSYSFTASLSNSGIAQIQGNATQTISAGGTGTFTVTGLAQGTVDITIQNQNQYGSQYVRKGIVHLTVGEGGTTPVDPPVGETVSYQLATTLEAGNDYIIANGNSGNVYVLTNEANGSRTLKGVAASVSGEIITLSSTNAAKAVFSAVANSNSSQGGLYLKNGSQYLYADSSNGLRLVDSSTQTSSSNNAKSWHYKADGKDLLWFFKDGSTDGYTDTSQTYKYYLECSSGNFTDNHVSTTSLSNSSNLPKMYIYTKVTQQIAVESVSLNKTTLTIGAGSSETLTATILPAAATNRNVTWTSSDSTVATVANGVVTGVKAGNATITVTTVDGGKTATCAVTVTPAKTITYALTETLEAGKEYLIANGNTGSVYLVSNEAGSSARQLKGVSATVVDGKITITETVAAKTAFTCYLEDSSNANSTRLKIGSQDLYTNNANGLRMFTMTSEEANKHWHYKGDGKDLLWFFKDETNNDGYSDTSGTYKYYLSCDSSGVFTDNHVTSPSLENTSNLPKIYLFTEAAHEHTYGDPEWEWKFTKAADGVSATAVFTCTECGEELRVDAKSEDITVTEENGQIIYTATVTGPDGKPHEGVKAEVAPIYQIKFTADKEFVEPGDTVTYTITLGPVDAFGSFQMKLVIPEGLTYVANSFKKATDIQDTLGFDSVVWTEESLVYNGYGIKDYVCEEDTVLGTFKCTVGEDFPGSATVKTTKHEFFSAKDFRTPTTELYEFIYVTVSNHDHEWTFVDFTWTETKDGYTAVANYKCEVTGTAHTESIDAAVSSETTPATCTAAGQTVYTATVAADKSLDGAAHTDTKTVAIEALGHDWEFKGFTWTAADNGYTAVANYKCKNDETHTDTVDATVTLAEGTGDDAGYYVYTAAVTAENSLDKQAHTDTKKEEMLPIRFATSISLDQQIGLNSYVGQLPKTAAVSEFTAKVYSGDEEIASVSFTELKGYELTPPGGVKSTYYFLKIADLAAKCMPDEYVVKVFRNGTEVAQEKFSIRGYCESRLEEGSGASDKNKLLCRATLTYGAEAQKHFDYKTNDLADKNIERVELTDIPADYAVSNDPTLAGISKVGTSGSFESQVYLNLYYVPESGYTIDDFTFKVEFKGEEVEFQKSSMSNGWIYLQLPSMVAKDLGTDFDITVTNKTTGASATWHRSAITYAYITQIGNGSATMKNLVKGLYQYYLASK